MNLIISKYNSWSEKLFELISNQSDNFIWLQDCNKQTIDQYNPEWIFFFHWSEIVSEEIYKNYKCVVVHTGNLPQGRGGSPLHNQILEGINITQVNLIEMCDILDGGGVYCSSQITLQGNINDIWFIIANVTKDLILKCINESLLPVLQKGVPKTYKRKKKNQIEFDKAKDISYIYDQIRILDSEYYPNAYIEIEGYKLEFNRAQLNNQTILTDVRITKQK